MKRQVFSNYVRDKHGWVLKLSKRKEGKCCVMFCRNRVYKGNYCTTHSKRRDYLKNPFRMYYEWLKTSANRRKISFKLTLDEFTQWALEVRLIEHKKSNVRKYWSVDRKKNDKGYEVGNLQLMPTSQNSSKAYWGDRATYPSQDYKYSTAPTRGWTPVNIISIDDGEDVPF